MFVVLSFIVLYLFIGCVITGISCGFNSIIDKEMLIEVVVWPYMFLMYFFTLFVLLFRYISSKRGE